MREKLSEVTGRISGREQGHSGDSILPSVIPASGFLETVPRYSVMC